MKKIAGQAWFVPAVIAVAIVGTLALYRNKDNLFGNSNEFGLTYISIDKAEEMMKKSENYDEGNFIIVYGNEDCGACKTFYEEIKNFRNSGTDSAKKYKFYNIDTKATPDTGTDFWDTWISGENKYGFNKLASGSEKFTSVSTPASIVVTNGDVENRRCYSGSATATEVDLELRSLK